MARRLLKNESRIMTRRLVPLLLLVLAVPGAAPADVREASPLDGFYDTWLAAVSHLMSDAERAAFLGLDDDLARELFMRRFWEARTPSLAGSQAPSLDAGPLARWRESYFEARRRFEKLDEDRARALVAAGKPAEVTRVFGCREVVRFLEVWTYEPWHVSFQKGAPTAPSAAPAEGLQLLFYRDSNLDAGVFRLWSPAQGIETLMYGEPRREWTAEELLAYLVEEACLERRGDDQVLATALREVLDFEELRHRLVEMPAPDWLAGFEAELRGDPALPVKSLDIDYPGRYQRKTILRGRLAVPASAVRRNAEGQLLDRLVVMGDVRLGDRLVDTFEIVFHVAGAAPDDDLVPLEMYRRLRHGTYTLNVRAEDAAGLGLLREVRTIEVPYPENEAEPPAGRWNGFAALTRDEVGVLTTFPSVEILPPGDDLPVGEVEIVAVTTGGPIERVEFLLDGEAVGGDAEPPFAIDLDLGEVPQRRRVEAVAYDPAGLEIARDAMELSPTRARRFAVHLVEPLPGQVRGTVRAVVEVPEDETLDRVELYLNQRRFATLRDSPFVHPLPPIAAAADGSAGHAAATKYLRAVAHLATGETAEDVVVVYSPDPIDEIDVHLIQLYVSVLDRRGRPVTGLGADEFRIFEDGAEQTVERFDTVEKLAINVALVMDVSGSMRGRVRMATRSAQRFFETVLTDKDLASLSVFNHDIQRVVPFTPDVERLRFGADDFRAYGTTRLHDSLIYVGHSFGGLKGKRALVLLSDGQDVDSDFQFKQVRESTLRSGIAVYPIMLALDDEETRANLEQLADETGGRYFSIRSVSELNQVYRTIEQDLRAQYLLVYEASNRGSRGGFRRVEVKLKPDDLEAITIRGYYP
jgi:VWFA-related protein